MDSSNCGVGTPPQSSPWKDSPAEWAGGFLQLTWISEEVNRDTLFPQILFSLGLLNSPSAKKIQKKKNLGISKKKVFCSGIFGDPPLFRSNRHEMGKNGGGGHGGTGSAKPQNTTEQQGTWRLLLIYFPLYFFCSPIKLKWYKGTVEEGGKQLRSRDLSLHSCFPQSFHFLKISRILLRFIQFSKKITYVCCGYYCCCCCPPSLKSGSGQVTRSIRTKICILRGCQNITVKYHCKIFSPWEDPNVHPWKLLPSLK